MLTMYYALRFNKTVFIENLLVFTGSYFLFFGIIILPLYTEHGKENN